MEITLLILLMMSVGISGAFFRHIYKLKTENQDLKRRLVDAICGELGEIVEDHEWTMISNASYGIKGSDDQNDILRTFECKKCNLLKRYWVGGLGEQLGGGNKMSGFFRFGDRMTELNEENISCIKPNKVKLLTQGL